MSNGKEAESEVSSDQIDEQLTGIYPLARLFMPEDEAEKWVEELSTVVCRNSGKIETNIVAWCMEAREKLLEMDESGKANNLGELLRHLPRLTDFQSNEGLSGVGQDLCVLRNTLAGVGGLEAEVLIWRFLVDLSPNDTAQVVGQEKDEILRLQFSGLQSLREFIPEHASTSVVHS